MPQAIFNKYKHILPHAAWKVFDEAKTAPLHATPHYFDKAHRAYSEAVGVIWKKFFADPAIQMDRMTGDQARDLLRNVLGSRDSRIRDYNVGLLKREVFRFRLRMPRGMD